MIPLFRLNKLKPESIIKYLEKKGNMKVWIYSYQHSAFWRANNKGYTDHKEIAGIYTLRQAYEASGHCSEEKGIYYMPKKEEPTL
jgi:hypothetical protein